ncbi:alpha/beta fold hydrolase [Variovorax sp. GT1P44]|uniref:alpha/beta fold hydrolase n=1 Tax=Variovorax sp. GT1P44 TaxID=3443742 RepID=UPI003F471338
MQAQRQPALFTASSAASGVLSAMALAIALILPSTGLAQTDQARLTAARPTVVLVHGAFAESSSWNGVISRLLTKGYPVVAVANPLRSVKSDANYVAGVLDTIPGSVVLVGHSYGGNVITNAATGKSNVKALVYVAGLAPDTGESAETLSGKFPGSTLGPTLAPPTPLSDGDKDLYIQQSKFHDQFAADLPASQARLMAVGQRPVTEAALKEGSGAPAWKNIPSWFIYGSRDKNIPPAVQPYMAKRAGAKRIVEVPGASHVVMTSHPDAVVKLIEEAAALASD